jgi:hypothetical protein
MRASKLQFQQSFGCWSKGEASMLARYFRSMKVGSLVLVVGLLSVAGVLLAQGQTAPAKSVGGQGAATKLTPDGQPDIQGIWRANPGGDTYDLTGNAGPRPDYNLQGNGTPRPPTRRVVDPPDGNIPYQPWAAAKEKDTQSHTDNPTKPEYVDTQAHCLLEGPVRVFIHSGFQIVQPHGYVLFLTEENDESRIVPLDGRPHLGSDIKLWQGDSRGHWEGNTLVIDVTNVKAKSRLDMVGNFYSPSAHFVERLTVVDDKTINYEATITDPTVYTQPWKISARFVRRFANDGSYELYEDACHEGERTADTLVLSSAESKSNAAGTTSSK